MTSFPDLILITLFNPQDKEPLANIAVQIRLFARHKNDYYLIPPLSDSYGRIQVTSDWVEKQIKQERDLFVMDYTSLSVEFEPKIEIRIMSQEQIDRVVQSMEEWRTILRIDDREIEGLRNASNIEYKSSTHMIEFNQKSVVYIDLVVDQ